MAQEIETKPSSLPPQQSQVTNICASCNTTAIGDPSNSDRCFSLQQNIEQIDEGPGLYAVTYDPAMMPMAGFPPYTLTPIKYDIPRRLNNGGTAGEHGGEARQQNAPQIQAARRFMFALQFDWLLVLKLVAMVYMFGRDGSKHRLIILGIVTVLLYLSQTGALEPFMRRMQHRAQPARPRPAVQPNNAPQNQENAGAGNENEPRETEPAAAIENQQEHGMNGIDLMGFAREIQTIVVGFITSLLPGFHNND